MSKVSLSYRAVLTDVVTKDDIDGMLNLIEQHKNWGAFTARLPSYIIVLLIDHLKTLKEQVAGFYAQPEPEDLGEEE